MRPKGIFFAALVILALSIGLYFFLRTIVASDWKLPSPMLTPIHEPYSGAYAFNGERGCFHVERDGTQSTPTILFDSFCRGERYGDAYFQRFSLEGGVFRGAFGEINGTDCPIDSFGISGSFVSERRAEGMVKTAYACREREVKPFTAELLPNQWVVREREKDGKELLEFYYVTGEELVGYAALHTDSGYFRLTHGKDSGWGTSVILTPTFWSKSKLFQGTAVSAHWKHRGSELELALSGVLHGLAFRLIIVFQPPGEESQMVEVSGAVLGHGEVALDARGGESFQIVKLSSMHVSPELWDASQAFAHDSFFPIPSVEGWVVRERPASYFGLFGGSSAWKAHAPTMRILTEEPVFVSGWRTAKNNPNEDNIGISGGLPYIPQSWYYTITATP